MRNDEDSLIHLVLQFKKSMDYGGRYDIQFRNGSKARISLADIETFLNTYDSLKPMDREEMQRLASESPEAFQGVLSGFVRPKMPKSIYVNPIKGK